jgi:hypothetical protein
VVQPDKNELSALCVSFEHASTYSTMCHFYTQSVRKVSIGENNVISLGGHGENLERNLIEESNVSIFSLISAYDDDNNTVFCFFNFINGTIWEPLV